MNTFMSWNLAYLSLRSLSASQDKREKRESSPLHETDLALFVHSPFDPHSVKGEPRSWYPCGHENEQFVLAFIYDVIQSPGDVFTGRDKLSFMQPGAETVEKNKMAVNVKFNHSKNKWERNTFIVW